MATVDLSATGLLQPGSLGIPTYYGSNVAIMGDSIAEQNSNSPVGHYLARGPITWMLSYLGWPWDYQPTDNHAVGGTGFSAIINSQLPALLAAHGTRKYSRCFISGGTNDTNSGNSLDSIKANALYLFRALRAHGIIPVHAGILPRGNDGAITDAKKKNMHLNIWLAEQAASGLIEMPGGAIESCADNAAAYGNCLAAHMYDSVLHPNLLGACLQGKAMADWYASRGIVPQMQFATQQGDKFDRTLNPTGVCFSTNSNPLLQGSVGDALGVVPTGMTISGAGSTWSKTTRTLANGQSRSDPTCAVASSVTHYLYDDWTATGAWSSTQLQPGDEIEFRFKAVLTSMVNLKNIYARLTIGDGVNVNTYYGLKVDDAANVMPNGNHTLYVKTPRITIPEYAGSGNALFYGRAEFITDSGASGSVQFHGFEARVMELAT